MRDKVAFVIPGKPFSKQRPRFSRATGRAFTPKETVSFEATVAALAAERIGVPFDGPVRLRIVATFKIPQSWPRKKAAAYLGKPHAQRPDLDNIVKAVSDGLNRIAYGDDAQIAAVVATKRWGNSEGTLVVIEDAGGTWQAVGDVIDRVIAEWADETSGWRHA